MLSAKQGGIKNHFWVFGITRLGIETWSPGPLANTLLIWPMAWNLNIFTIDFEIMEKKTSLNILFSLKIIQKRSKNFFRSIIIIQKHGVENIYILVVQNIQYRKDASLNVPVWPCSLSKRSLTSGPDQSTGISDSHSSWLKADVADRAACPVFVFKQKEMHVKKI